MRLFIALVLPDETLDAVAETADALQRRVRGRFVLPGTYHMTLAFIGEADGAMAAAAEGALERACRGAAPIALRPSALGKFGPAGNATLWVGFDRAGADAARDLAERVREELRGADVPFDGKPFKAHVTIARRANLSRADLPPLGYFPAARVRSVALFESELSREGARYRIVHEVEL